MHDALYILLRFVIFACYVDLYIFCLVGMFHVFMLVSIDLLLFLMQIVVFLIDFLS